MLGEDCFDLLDRMAGLEIAGARRETGVVEAGQMPWNTGECRLGLEYKSIYVSRIEKLRHRFKIPGVIPIAQVSKNNQKYTISGTIKRLELKRIRAFEKQFQDKYNGTVPIYDPLDELEIEDHSGKLKIELVECVMGWRNVVATDLPFGVQVVLEGRFKKHSNKFLARVIHLPELPPQTQFERNYVTEEGVQMKGKKMLVMSEPTFDQCFAIADLLQKSYSEEIQSITALVIIGGMDLKIESIASMAKVMKRLKDIVDVFIMPSSTLDRRRLYPLQPYNGNFFLQSCREIGLCSDPQLFNIENGMKIHVSCGENVVDFMKNCSLAKTEVEVLQNFINFSHYCPTSPFSLKTEPFMEDELVMEQIPHVIVTGKAKQFQARVHRVEGREVLLVAVPERGMGLISLNQLQATSFT